MLVIILFAIVAFAVTACLARVGRLRQVWMHADFIYYPLAALGILLVFYRDTKERQLLAKDAAVSAGQAALAAARSARPALRARPDSSFEASSFALIKNIHELADICRSVPGRDSVCAAAMDFDVLTAPVVRVLDNPLRDPEERLVDKCVAADSMIEAARTRLPFVGIALADAYGRAGTVGYQEFDYDSYVRAGDSLNTQMLADIGRTENAMHDTSDATRRVFATYRAQAGHARFAFLALFPCVTSGPRDKAAYREWASQRRSVQELLVRAESDRNEVRLGEPEAQVMRWVRLGFWPYVLLVAVAIKFGKAVAGFHSPEAASGASAGQPSNPPEPPEQADGKSPTDGLPQTGPPSE